MDTTRVKDLMVPVAEYATVGENATLHEVVLMIGNFLKKAQTSGESEDAPGSRMEYPYRAVLVTDPQGKVVGKISQTDVLRSLEPKYDRILRDPSAPIRLGFSMDYLMRAVRDYGLWEKPLDDLCRKAAEKKARDVMHVPAEDEIVDEDLGLNEAAHQMIIGHHQSLLVTRQERIVGILRLTDVFAEICRRMKACVL
jgi:CBS domain-containing protein